MAFQRCASRVALTSTACPSACSWPADPGGRPCSCALGTTSSARPTGTCATPRSRYRKVMSTAIASSIFEQLGIAPVINARGNNTVLGGSTPSARVHRAMQDAERYYVDMQQLLERSGKAIAEL